jgi:uncharacterized membrane protein YkoI
MNRFIPDSMAFIVALIGMTACEHVGIFEPFREVECLQRAKVSLKEAIATAESSGGKALDADFREDEEMGCLGDNPGAYDITFLAGETISVVSVNARSGVLGPREDASVMNVLFGSARFEGSSVDMARSVPALGIGISQAITIAERQGGKAMSAWIEAKDGMAGYTVKVVKNGRVRVTWVDGRARAQITARAEVAQRITRHAAP